MKMRIVVVGNGMVGHHFLSQLGAEQHSVTLLASEASPAYDRVHLSELFSGKTADELALGTPQQYQELGIDAFFGDPVVSIDRDARRVSTASGNEVQYDKLVLATGSYPFVPPIKGNDHPRCLVYRTLDDLEAIRTAAAGGKTGVVVGGGLLGLECANALQNLGLETHVVEFGPGLMGVQLDAEGSATLQYKIEDLGITVHTNDCETLSNFIEMPEQWVDVQWEVGAEDTGNHVSRINVILANRPGSLAAMTAVIGRYQGNISNLKITDRSEDFFEMQIDIEVNDVQHLTNIIAGLRADSAVGSVERAQN